MRQEHGGCPDVLLVLSRLGYNSCWTCTSMSQHLCIELRVSLHKAWYISTCQVSRTGWRKIPGANTATTLYQKKTSLSEHVRLAKGGPLENSFYACNATASAFCHVMCFPPIRRPTPAELLAHPLFDRLGEVLQQKLKPVSEGKITKWIILSYCLSLNNRTNKQTEWLHISPQSLHLSRPLSKPRAPLLHWSLCLCPGRVIWRSPDWVSSERGVLPVESGRWRPGAGDEEERCHSVSATNLHPTIVGGSVWPVTTDCLR